MKNVRLAMVFLVAVLLTVGALNLGAQTGPVAGQCPLCGAEGIAVPDRDQLGHCECEKWWRGQAPARLVFADCSVRQCAENGPNADTPRVYVDIHLYRCPKDGLLFTEPQ